MCKRRKGLMEKPWPPPFVAPHPDTVCVCLSLSDDHYDISLSGRLTRSPQTRLSLSPLRFLPACLSACLSAQLSVSLSLPLFTAAPAPLYLLKMTATVLLHVNKV